MTLRGVAVDTAAVAAARRAALTIGNAGLAAADPAEAVRRTVTLTSDGIAVSGREFPCRGRVVVLGAGKASLRVVQALEDVLGERLDDGLVVVRRGEAGPARRCRVLEADHPVPTADSVLAAEAVLAMAGSLGEGDLALCVMTGGCSALLSLPPEGVSPTDKFELHALLLASGAGIIEVNAVRKHVSAVKAGRVAVAAAPATVVNLTVSDVAGDRLDCISDPTVNDASTVDDAIEVLCKYQLWERVAPSIRHLLEQRGPATRSPVVAAETTLLVTGDTVCDAMTAAAEAEGYRGIVMSTAWHGEAATLGARIAAAARVFDGPCAIVACGGEATVTLDDWAMRHGQGGPNQELAVAAVANGLGAGTALLALDTDGSDGGTASAGAIVDSSTSSRVADLGLDLGAALAEHRCGPLLAELDGLVATGPTGTNVNDLLVLVVDARADAEHAVDKLSGGSETT